MFLFFENLMQVYNAFSSYLHQTLSPVFPRTHFSQEGLKIYPLNFLYKCHILNLYIYNFLSLKAHCRQNFSPKYDLCYIEFKVLRSP